MLRLSHASWLLLPAALLGGCPIYSDGCQANDDCEPGYACDYPSGTCQVPDYTGGVTPGPTRCHTSSDCADGLVCDRYLRCSTPGGEAGADGMAGANGTAAASGSGAGGAGESGAAGR
jgi:hypothetical protein